MNVLVSINSYIVHDDILKKKKDINSKMTRPTKKIRHSIKCQGHGKHLTIKLILDVDKAK